MQVKHLNANRIGNLVQIRLDEKPYVDTRADSIVRRKSAERYIEAPTRNHRNYGRVEYENIGACADEGWWLGPGACQMALPTVP